MFLYYRLAKEPPYKKGLKYDVFISFASEDREFVEDNVRFYFRYYKYILFTSICFPDL